MDKKYMNGLVVESFVKGIVTGILVEMVSILLTRKSRKEEEINDNE